MAGTDNRRRPIKDVPQFVARAKDIGCYTPSQATNLSTAFGVAQEGANLSEGWNEEATVETVMAAMPKWFAAYGGNKRATHGSVTTYKARFKRLLEDFIRWNDNDFAAWKEEIAKKPTPKKATRKRSNRKTQPKSAGQDDGAPAPGTSTHELKLPGSRTARLVVPDGMSTTDIEKLWAQLGAIRTLLEAQATIDDEQAEDDQES